MTNPDTAIVSVAARTGNALQYTHPANLRFESVPGQISTFAPLQVVSVACTPVQEGLEPTILVNDGRVVVMGEKALLEPVLVTPPLRRLLVYVRPGTSYTIEYSTNAANPAAWKVFATVPASQFPVRSLSLGSSPAPPIYYRIRQ